MEDFKKKMEASKALYGKGLTKETQDKLSRIYSICNEFAGNTEEVEIYLDTPNANAKYTSVTVQTDGVILIDSNKSKELLMRLIAESNVVRISEGQGYPYIEFCVETAWEE